MIVLATRNASRQQRIYLPVSFYLKKKAYTDSLRNVVHSFYSGDGQWSRKIFHVFAFQFRLSNKVRERYLNEMPEFNINILRTDCDFNSSRALVENSVVELE